MNKKTHSLYGTQEWKKLRLQVLQEGNYICHWCGGKATQADHLIERDRDPDLQLERSNLVPACQPCNSRRGSLYQAKTRQERAARNGGHGYSMQWPIPCLRCGKTFTPDWRNTKRGQGKYCSRECAGSAKKPRWEYIVTWQCRVCKTKCTDGPYESTAPPQPQHRQTCDNQTCHEAWVAMQARDQYRKRRGIVGGKSKYPDTGPDLFNCQILTEPSPEEIANLSLRSHQTTPPPSASKFPKGKSDADESGLIVPEPTGIGRNEPRLVTPALGSETYGPVVAEWVERNMNYELMDWQRLVLDGQLTHDGTGMLEFSESLVSVGRQNGKSWAMGGLICAWLTDLTLAFGRPQTVLSSAHKLDRAYALFKEFAPVLEEKHGAKLNWSYGRNVAELPNGSRWYVAAATPQNAHGASADLVCIDEIWNINPEVIFDAYRPTMTARQNPLMSMWSTAGDESSKAMVQLREQALHALDKGTRSNLYFAEWSPPPGAPLNEPATWEWANPAMGTTITSERLRRMSDTPNKQAFYRAHCNVWISAAASWLPAGLWDTLETDDDMPAGGWLAVDADVTDLRYCGVRVAQTEAGTLQAKTEFTVESAEQMWQQVAEVMEDADVKLLLSPGLAAVCPTELRYRMNDWGQREITTYTQLVRNMILEKRLHHSGQMALSEQVQRAVSGRVNNTITLSSVKSPGPIEQCRCMVVAAGMAAKPQTHVRRPMMGTAS